MVCSEKSVVRRYYIHDRWYVCLFDTRTNGEDFMKKKSERGFRSNLDPINFGESSVSLPGYKKSGFVHLLSIA